MSSPVSISFSSFVSIDRQKKDPVYLQLVYQFIHAVKRKLLEEGDQLPGSRSIAQDLQLHRKTIVAALEELQEQGWVQTIPSVGTFVNNPEGSATTAADNRAYLQPPERAPFYFKKEFVLDSPFQHGQEKLFFTDGTPDYKVIKVEELVRSYASVLRRATDLSESENRQEGNVFFREQLSYYLNVSRSFHLSRHFLLPITGREQVFAILSRLLISKGDIVLVEDLSFYLPNMIFTQAGARLKTVSVDAEGMDIDYIAANFKPGEIRVVYLNPRSQYPTGVQLSIARKARLLELAHEFDFIIVEDDADFEFSDPREKFTSLHREDGGNRVIYIGAFGRFLAPGFQMNFLIAPKDLVEEGEKYLSVFGKPNFMMEKALGEIIYQGDIHRYQRKSRRVLAERKERFACLLHLHFRDNISFSMPPAGLAFWIRFEDGISLSLLQEKARKRGLLIPGICLFQNRNLSALRLGFAHLNQKDMEEAVKILAQSYREILPIVTS